MTLPNTVFTFVPGHRYTGPVQYDGLGFPIPDSTIRFNGNCFYLIATDGAPAVAYVAINADGSLDLDSMNGDIDADSEVVNAIHAALNATARAAALDFEYFIGDKYATA